MAHRLKDRIQIQQPIQTAVASGNLDRTYETIKTIWAELKPVSTFSSQTTRYRGSHIRGEQIMVEVTHKALIRRSSVSRLGRAFSYGFSTGFDSIADINPMKTELFVFVEEGSSIKGRLFKIMTMENVKERRELIALRLMEIEEQGTGARV